MVNKDQGHNAPVEEVHSISGNHSEAEIIMGQHSQQHSKGNSKPNRKASHTTADKSALKTKDDRTTLSSTLLTNHNAVADQTIYSAAVSTANLILDNPDKYATSEAKQALYTQELVKAEHKNLDPKAWANQESVNQYQAKMSAYKADIQQQNKELNNQLNTQQINRISTPPQGKVTALSSTEEALLQKTFGADFNASKPYPYGDIGGGLEKIFASIIDKALK